MPYVRALSGGVHRWLTANSKSAAAAFQICVHQNLSYAHDRCDRGILIRRMPPLSLLFTAAPACNGFWVFGSSSRDTIMPLELKVPCR